MSSLMEMAFPENNLIMDCLMEMHFSPPQAEIFDGFWFQIIGIPFKIVDLVPMDKKIRLGRATPNENSEKGSEKP